MLRVAIEGCCHGELNQIYASIAKEEARRRIKVDLLIICGDFQAMRNMNDLTQMACPPKYRKLGTFHEYYSGKVIAPIPTIFVGGNHEASNYLWELFYGGWVCPNIYYLGCAGVVNFAGLRIGGLSGIYNSHHYQRGFNEKMPLTGDDIRSIYHLRQINVLKMEQIKSPIDVFVSHDWPRDIAAHGDKAGLLQRKRFLKNEIEAKTLGSPPAEMLLKKLKPRFWFSAHMHVRFEATVKHTTENHTNPDAIAIDDSDLDSDEQEKPNLKRKRSFSPVSAKETRFLSLDKCLPGRQFLEILEIPCPEQPKTLNLDREWLAILKAFDKHHSYDFFQKKLPSVAEIQANLKEATKFVDEKITDEDLIPPYFIKTAQEHMPGREAEGFPIYSNPQTEELCKLLEIKCKINTDGIKIERPKVETLEEAKKRLLRLLDV